MGPAFVVIPIEFEELLVALAFQEFGMIVKGGGYFAVAAKTFVGLIIIGMISASGPVIRTFYPKMVARSAGQLTIAIVGLQYSLRQGDAGRYTVMFHFLTGDFLVGLNILLRGHFATVVQPPMTGGAKGEQYK